MKTAYQFNLANMHKSKLLLKEAGILHLINVSIEDQPGDDSWESTTVLAGSFDGIGGNEVHTERLGWQFSPEVFAIFFTQRKDWLLATPEDRMEAFDRGIHPAFFKEEYQDIKHTFKRDMPGFEGTMEALNTLTILK